MATIVTRAGKGSPLTNVEVDANFTNLNTDVLSRLLASSNLSDLANAATARTNLGLGNVENKSSTTIRGELTSGNVTTALGFTPYNATNPSSYVDTAGARSALSFVAGSGGYNSTTGVITIPTNTNQLTNGAGFSTTTGTVTSVSGTGTVSGLTLSGSVTSSGSLTLGGTLSLTSGQVTTALGFTPYNSTNPSGYITSSGSITGNAGTVTNGVYTTGDQTIGGQKTFSSVVNTSSGRYTTSSTGVGMYEMHLPGYAARAWYLDTAGVTRLAYTNGGGTASTILLTIDTGGNFTAASNVTAYSDERLKTDWADLPDDFVDRLAGVKHGTYTRIDNGERQAGSSAQDWQRLLPEVVVNGEHLSLAYGNAALVSAIKLAQRVIDLERQVKSLLAATNTQR